MELLNFLSIGKNTFENSLFVPRRKVLLWGTDGDKLGEKWQIRKLKNKNLQIWT